MNAFVRFLGAWSLVALGAALVWLIIEFLLARRRAQLREILDEEMMLRTLREYRLRATPSSAAKAAAASGQGVGKATALARHPDPEYCGRQLRQPLALDRGGAPSVPSRDTHTSVPENSSVSPPPPACPPCTSSRSSRASTTSTASPACVHPSSNPTETTTARAFCRGSRAASRPSTPENPNG